MSDPQNPNAPANPPASPPQPNQPWPPQQPVQPASPWPTQQASQSWPTQQTDPAPNAGWPTQPASGWPGQQPAAAPDDWAGQQQQPGYAQPQGAGGTWPPQPATWPPPVGATAYQTAFFKFKFQYLKVRGYIADFREGVIGIDPGGVTISGKVQPRAEIYQTVWIIAFIIARLIGVIIAVLIMRYAMLKPMELRLSWHQVHEIVLNPQKQRACVVYDAPNYKNIMKTWCFAFRLPQAEYDQFAAMAQQCAPHHTHEGKIGSASTAAWILLAVLLGLLIFIAIMVVRH